MRVFHHHLAKTGGSTIKKIAKDQYRENFHYLTPSTSTEELKTWLSKKDFFISSYTLSLGYEKIQLLLLDKTIKRIIVSRDPIERFKSFCAAGYSNIPKEDFTKGLPYWGNEAVVTEPLNASLWLKSSLKYMELLLLYGKERVALGQWNFSLSYPVYSQWWLASCSLAYNAENKQFEYCGTNIYNHILKTREELRRPNSNKSLEDYIGSYLLDFYSAFGTTDNIIEFVELLIAMGIFEDNIDEIPREHRSTDVQKDMPELFEIDDSLIADYYSLIPEDFMFHFACRELAKEQMSSVVMPLTNNKINS